MVHDCDDENCVTEQGSSYGQVCNITGCIVKCHEYKEEKNCFERTNCLVSFSSCDSEHAAEPDRVLFKDELPSKRKWKYSLQNLIENNQEVPKKRDKRRKLSVESFDLDVDDKKSGHLMSSLGNANDSPNNFHGSSNEIFFSNAVQQPKNIFCVLSVFDNNMNKFHDCILETVTELLFSEKTRICFREEMRRNEAKVLSVFSKLLKTSAHHCLCTRPNMANIFCELFHVHQKCRMLYFENESNKKQEIIFLIEKCVSSISYLLLNFGGCRVARQMQNATRCREFICSMLFLMRMGVTYQKRQLLPKIELLNDYLPMQVLLPNIFNIRAKSITEGENIIKLDIRKIPWI